MEKVNCIDIVYYPNHNVILVPVTVNGIETYFQLDTGAPTSISTEIFDTLNLVSINHHQGIDYYGNEKVVVETIIPSLTIGDTEYKATKNSVVDVPQSFIICGHKLGGYLGSDFFMDKAVQIDVSQKQLLISNSVENFYLDDHFKQDFKIYFGQKSPFIFIHIPAIELVIEAEFDTGSSSDYLVINYDVKNKLIANDYIYPENILDTLKRSDNGRGLFGKQKDTLNFRFSVDSILLSGARFYNFPVLTADIDYSRLGSPILRHGIVTVDFINKHFFFKPSSSSTIDLLRSLDITFHYNENGFIVSSIREGSNLANTGIKVGYYLREVASIRLDTISECDFMLTDWKNIFAKKETIKLVFETPEGDIIDHELVYSHILNGS